MSFPIEPSYALEDVAREAGGAASRDLAAARAACPFDVDLDALASAVAGGDLDRALGIVLRSHPWASILGTACQKPCEAVAEAHGIRLSLLERVAGDHGRRERFPFRAGPPTGRRVAIIGAGSASCAAAYRLRQLGVQVTMYEQLPVPGGMMYVGYPDFRLDRTHVLRENDPEAWGVDVHYGVRVDRTLLQRLCQSFDAVLLGIGKFEEVRLGVPGDDLQGVWAALTFLTEHKLGRQPRFGPRVVVVGNGDTAQDAARTCRRLGCQVTVLYWRGPTDARGGLQRRARLAEAEGVTFLYYATVVRAIGANGRLTAVECVRTEETADDASDRAGPRVVPGSAFTLECDTFIEATGETVGLSFLPPEVRRTDDERQVWVDPATWQTSVPGLFAAGEATGLVSTTMWAFWSGFQAAAGIEAFLRASAAPPLPG